MSCLISQVNILLLHIDYALETKLNTQSSRLNIVISLLAGSLLDKIDVIGIQVVIVSSNVGLAFGNLLLKDSFIELLEVFNMVEMQVGKGGLKKTCVIVLSILMLSWAISFVAFTFVFTFVLINRLGINIFAGNQV